jgi:hypothetical protein
VEDDKGIVKRDEQVVPTEGERTKDICEPVKKYRPPPIGTIEAPKGSFS